MLPGDRHRLPGTQRYPNCQDRWASPALALHEGVSGDRLNRAHGHARGLEHRAFSWNLGFPNRRTVIHPAWRWIMGRSYSLDLRQRVIDRIAGGQSRRGAAEDMSVSASFAVKLVARHERTGSLEP